MLNHRRLVDRGGITPPCGECFAETPRRRPDSPQPKASSSAASPSAALPGVVAWRGRPLLPRLPESLWPTSDQPQDGTDVRQHEHDEQPEQLGQVAAFILFRHDHVDEAEDPQRDNQKQSDAFVDEHAPTLRRRQITRLAM